MIGFFRDIRQAKVAVWCRETFGEDHFEDENIRARRFFEEAVELCQALVVDESKLHDIVSKVYAKPLGKVEQEIGGVQVCLLALCSCLGLSANELEAKEIYRIKGKSKEHFQKRNQQKIDEGY